MCQVIDAHGRPEALLAQGLEVPPRHHTGIVF
jgi:hypothetical protein